MFYDLQNFPHPSSIIQPISLHTQSPGFYGSVFDEIFLILNKKYYEKDFQFTHSVLQYICIGTGKASFYRIQKF
jgi:hypothetical protein